MLRQSSAVGGLSKRLAIAPLDPSVEERREITQGKVPPYLV